MRLTSTLFGFACIGLVACSTNDSKTPSEQAPSAAQSTTQAAAPAKAKHATAPLANGLERVADASLVCMVNNKFMGETQIPVEHGGQTYYGCCEMCVGKIQNDPKARTAVDPVTKRPVDKALAVMAKDAKGKIYYFENEQNLARFSL